MAPKSKIVVATGLIAMAVAFMSASLLRAEPPKPFTDQQRKDLNDCIAKFCEDVAKCLREHPNASPSDCQKAASAGYQVCKKSHGIPLAQYRLPKFPDYGPAGGTRPEVKPPDSGQRPPRKGLSDTSTTTGTVKDKATPTATPTPEKSGD